MNPLDELINDRKKYGKVLCYVTEGLRAYVVVEFENAVRIEEWALVFCTKGKTSTSKYVLVEYVELSKKALEELTTALMVALALRSS